MNPLDEWTGDVAAALQLDPETLPAVRDLLLELTRDVAHGVARPAAPLTAFLVGLAAGRAGGTASDVRAAVLEVLELLVSRADADPETPPG